MNSLNDNIKSLIYEYDGNDYNKYLFNKVIQELNLKRLNDFIKYNIYIDNKYLCSCQTKTSRIYIMDMLRNEDFYKYTDYNVKLNEWGEHKELMKRSDKLEIAKNLMNHKELYKCIMDMIKGAEDDFIIDFYFDFVVNYNYFDKQIMKNEVYENFDITTDTENEDYDSDDDYNYETETDEETDEDDD